MLYTTIPAALAMVVYLFIGFGTSGDLVRPKSVQLIWITRYYVQLHNITLYCINNIRFSKWPTIPTMLNSLLTVVLGL